MTDFVSFAVIGFVLLTSAIVLFLLAWTLKILLSLEIIFEPSAGEYLNASQSESISHDSDEHSNGIQTTKPDTRKDKWMKLNSKQSVFSCIFSFHSFMYKIL